MAIVSQKRFQVIIFRNVQVSFVFREVYVPSKSHPLKTKPFSVFPCYYRFFSRKIVKTAICEDRLLFDWILLKTGFNRILFLRLKLYLYCYRFNYYSGSISLSVFAIQSFVMLMQPNKYQQTISVPAKTTGDAS